VTNYCKCHIFERQLNVLTHPNNIAAAPQTMTPATYKNLAPILPNYRHSKATLYTVSQKKFPPLNSVALSNLNRFSKFYTAEKHIKFATKSI